MRYCGVAPFAFGLTLMAASPGLASTKDWETASTIGVAGLTAAALGVPVVKGDWPGFAQAGGSVLVGAGTAYGLKHVIHARRPDGDGNDSFPSAHTSIAFSSAATLHRRYGWEVGVPATLVAAFVGLARVEAKRHHWYDVVAGAAIGEASGMLITRPFNGNVQLVPWGDTKGGGLALSMRF